MDKNVTLSNLRVEGLRPDGYAQYNSDLVFLVTIDYTALSNCSPTGGCDDAAYVEFYLNGSKVQSSVWNQYISDGIGWVATYRYVVPVTTSPGSNIIVKAKSSNTLSIKVPVAAPLAGSDPIPATSNTDDYYDSEGNSTVYNPYANDTSGVLYDDTGGLSTTDYAGYLTSDDTTSSNTTTTDTDTFINKIKTFYESNKTVSIIGIALIGGFIMFGGRRR